VTRRRAAEAAALLGEEVASVGRLQGGDLSEVIRLRCASGRSVVLKAGATARAEAAMLDAIRAAGAPAPAVLGVLDDLLVLEDLGQDHGPGGAWGHLGEVVRRLHATTGTGYGWPADYRFAPCRSRTRRSTTGRPSGRRGACWRMRAGCLTSSHHGSSGSPGGSRTTCSGRRGRRSCTATSGPATSWPAARA
jgi:hypothetical protein